jgi:hypothetical protein
VTDDSSFTRTTWGNDVMLKKVSMILVCTFLLTGVAGCSEEKMTNRGDLSARVPCMEKKNIKFELRADGFYLSDDQWDKFIRFCS